MDDTGGVDILEDTFFSINAKIQALLAVWPSEKLKAFAEKLAVYLRVTEIPQAEKADFVQQINRELEIFDSSPNVGKRVVDHIFPLHIPSRIGSIVRRLSRNNHGKTEKRVYNLIPSLSDRVTNWEKRLEELNSKARQVEAYRRYERLFNKVVMYIQHGEKDVIILSGMVGIGKTMMAQDVKGYFERGSLFPGGVHFLQFSDKLCSVQDSLKQGLQRLSNSMKLHVDGGTDIWQALSMATRRQKCLLILDGVRDTEVINRFRFPHHKGKLLVTSRQQKLWNSAKLFLIHPSDSQASKLDEWLLLKLTSPDAMAQEVKDVILRKCGGCLRLVYEMGSVLQTKTISWEQITDDSFSDSFRSLDIFKDVAVCVDALPPDAQKVMEYFGLFQPGVPIPEEIVAMGWECMPSLSNSALSQLFIDSVCDLNLVTCNRGESNVSYTLHPLISEYWLMKRPKLWGELDHLPLFMLQYVNVQARNRL